MAVVCSGVLLALGGLFYFVPEVFLIGASELDESSPVATVAPAPVPPFTLGGVVEVLPSTRIFLAGK